MRDWSEINEIYDELVKSVYPQPEDEGHTLLAQNSVYFMMKNSYFSSVIDFGCGTGFCQPMFDKYNVRYQGVAMGEDVKIAQALGRNVIEGDFNFLNLNETFEAGFSRHSLEHSPFPILTLCHWKRFIEKWLMVVLPAAEWYRYKGQNHFSVMPEEQAENVFELAGFELYKKRIEYRWGLPYMESPTTETKYEYWYLLKKK